MLLICLLAMPTISTRADVIDEGQSTEGKDFWVTFMQADQNDHSDASDKAITLALTVSAKEDCKVTFTNPITGEKLDTTLTAGSIAEVPFYTGDGGEYARTRTDAQKARVTCYTIYPDSADHSAIHVESTGTISLFASNRREKSFDATNVLPTPSLLDEYLIQTVAPSDHQNKPQGTHFCIIATEDNTVVDYCPTVYTDNMIALQNAAKDLEKYIKDNNLPEDMLDTLLTENQKRLLNFQLGKDTLTTPVLNKGQVYYIWTGKHAGNDADFSGTWLKARDKKKIAVFQGAPHTNLPNKIRDRDHLFSQAMPVQYWGNTFAITASMTRGRDIIRIMAREDGTEVHIKYTLPDGSIKDSLAHTFDFASNLKRTFEFEIGEKGVKCTDSDYKKEHKDDQTLPDPLVIDSSCFITTSCPAATHLFMVSNTYDANPVGDPAMVWVNPIEQQINDITFATYGSSNTHYVNIVTDKEGVASMKLDDKDISDDFSPVSGSDDKWYFARKNITWDTHHLTGNTGFIAHVYGYGNKESYGYSAGGATVPLSQSIYINGEEFSPDKENKLCGKDTVEFACKPDFLPDSIIWHFGDGTPDVKLIQDTTTIVKHYFNGTQDFNASCLIYRNSSNVCVGQSAVTVIPIKVTIGRYSFSIGDPDIPCPEGGVQAPGRIPYTSTIDLTGDHVHIGFDSTALAAGFDSTKIGITPTNFLINIPAEAQSGVPYGITIDIESNCGDTTATMFFSLPVGNDVIDQRYSNVLGILKDHKDLKGMTLSEFQWYRKSDSTAIEGQVSSNLNMYDLPVEQYKNDAFYVCYTINKGQADQRRSCACAKEFDPNSKEAQFDTNPDGIIISAYYEYGREKVFVNADWNGKTDIECYAQWINVKGDIYRDEKFNIPDGGCTIPVPAENGLYLLRVRTDGKSRSFKFFINH